MPAIFVLTSPRELAGKVDAVAVGADRVVANGDTANKIGTLQLAIAASHYGIPFLVVAPLTSCDTEVTQTADQFSRSSGEGCDFASNFPGPYNERTG